jgi:hypothetical protein
MLHLDLKLIFRRNFQRISLTIPPGLFGTDGVWCWVTLAGIIAGGVAVIAAIVIVIVCAVKRKRYYLFYCDHLRRTELRNLELAFPFTLLHSTFSLCFLNSAYQSRTGNAQGDALQNPSGAPRIARLPRSFFFPDRCWS